MSESVHIFWGVLALLAVAAAFNHGRHHGRQHTRHTPGSTPGTTPGTTRSTAT